MFKQAIATAALAALALSSAQALAAQATANFQVQITIQASCDATITATDLDFGTRNAEDVTNLDTTSTIAVKCSKNTPYTIALVPQSTSSLVGEGEMSGTGGNSGTKVAYGMYQDSGRSTPWGTGDDAKSGSGAGLGVATPADVHTVYGRVPSADVVPDVYTDTVNVTLTY